MSRELLDELEEAVRDCVRSGGVVIGVLPTGYGKTSFVRERLLSKVVGRGLRVLHVLPLRAIVCQTAGKAVEKARKLGDPEAVGFQAGVEVRGVDKSPYLARDYMVVTIDSFLLSFYGVPVYELMRGEWHSDAAYLLARSFDVLILDEFHLMVAGDAEEMEGDVEINLLAKQIASLSFVLETYLRLGKCVVILTATLPPSALEKLLSRLSRRIGKFKVYLIAYGLNNHPYIKSLTQALQLAGVNVVKHVVRDGDFGTCGKMKTFLFSVPYVAVNVDGVQVYVPNLERVINDPDVGNALRNAQSVFIAFNSWRRAYAAYKTFGNVFERRFGLRTLLITGIMSVADRERVLDELDKQASAKELGASPVEKERICLFATQVVEAGVDQSFDVLITEAAPATALIQRVGRVSRYTKPKEHNVVVILTDEEKRVEPLVKGVYDIEVSAKTIDELKRCLNPTDNKFKGEFEWRCVDVSKNCCDAWNLIASIDPIISSKLQNALRDAIEAEEALNKLLIAARPPYHVVKELDHTFDGSFVRRSALLPLVRPEALSLACRDLCDKASRGEIVELKSFDQVTQNSVTVAKDFIKGYRSCLCLCEDSAIALLLEERRVPRVRPVKVRVDDIVSRPLYTMWSRSVYYGARFLGLVLADNVYDEGLGLKPVKRGE